MPRRKSAGAPRPASARRSSGSADAGGRRRQPPRGTRAAHRGLAGRGGGTASRPRGVAQAAAAMQRAIAAAERDAEEAAERARLRTEALATRDALCVRVETLDGDDVLGTIESRSKKSGDRSCPSSATARRPTDWRSDSPRRWPRAGNDTSWAPCWRRRAPRSRRSSWKPKRLPTQEETAAAGARWQALVREARGLAASLADGGASGARSRRASRCRGRRVRGARARRGARAIEQAQHETLARLQRLVERANRAADADTITLREGERLMRDIRHRARSDRAWRRRSPARQPRVADGRQPRRPPRAAGEGRAARPRTARDGRLAPLRQRAAAGTAHLDGRDDRRLARRRRSGRPRGSDLRHRRARCATCTRKWKDVAEAPRDKAQRLWERFRIATDFIRVRCERLLHEAARRARRQPPAQDRHRRRSRSAGELDRLGRRPRRGCRSCRPNGSEIGPVAARCGRDLAHRFRTACNQFFRAAART